MHSPTDAQAPYGPPSLTGWIRSGWHAFTAEAGVFVMTTLGMLFLMAGLWVVLVIGRHGFQQGWNPMLFVLQLGLGIALVPLRYGMMSYGLAILRGRRPEPTEILAGYGRPWHILGVTLLLGILVCIGALLLVVPGIILGLGLVFAPLITLDRRAGIMDSLRASWSLTQGARCRLLGFFLLLGLLTVALVLATCGLGVLVAQPLACTATAAAYLDLSRRRGQEPATEVPTGPPDPLAMR